MSDYLTVEEAADLVSAFVGLCPENETRELYRLLTLAQTKAWKKGIFKGFVRSAHVNVRHKTVGGKEKAFIITPHGYEILLGVNLDGKPKLIRDTYFQFNQGSQGSIEDCCGCNFTDDVFDLGEQPVINQPCENVCCCGEIDCNNRSIGVIGYQCDIRCQERKDNVIISGLTHLGNPVYTYEVDDPYSESHNECKCTSDYESEPDRQLKIIDGDVFPVKSKLVVHNNIKWSRVDSIRKKYTDGPVEVFAVCGNDTELLARIEPYQSASRYRIYELPDCCCKYECVHALLKIGKPEKLEHPSQHMIIDDEESLIALVKSLDMTYNKEEIEMGEALLIKGMNNLDDEHKQNRSNTRTPVIVDVCHDDEIGDWS